MIGKSFLGESLNFPIGQLKLSYKRIFPIIGESLAEMRSGLRRGGLFGIFIAEYAMKPPFFELFPRFCACFLGVFRMKNLSEADF